MMDSLDRILKTASAADPGTQAMAAAAQSAGSIPGAVRAPAMPAPEDPPADPAAISKLQNEVGKRDKEIADLRAKVQDAKNQAALVQMKQQMSEDREKMRDELRKEYTQMQDKIRSQQKELDNRQALFKQEEANHKAQMMAAQAQHKSKLAEIASNHQTTLQNQIADQKVTLAQNEAKSLKEIADMESNSRMQQADDYIAMTDKVRKDSERIQQEKEKEFAAKHPAVSPLLQDRINSATSAVARLAKNNNNLDLYSMKAANYFMKQSDTADRLTGVANFTPRPGPAVDDRLQRRMNSFNEQFGGDSGYASDAAMAVARAENALARAKAEGNSADAADLQHYISQTNNSYNRLMRQQEAAAAKGDVEAQRDLAVAKAQSTSGWFGGSELDKVRNQWQKQQDDNNRGWFGKVLKGAWDWTIGGAIDGVDDVTRANRIKDHFNAESNWWSGGKTKDPRMQQTYDQFMDAADLPQSVGAQVWRAGLPIADLAWTAGTLGSGALVSGAIKGVAKGVGTGVMRRLGTGAAAKAVGTTAKALGTVGSGIRRGVLQPTNAAIRKIVPSRVGSFIQKHPYKSSIMYGIGRGTMNAVLPDNLTGANYGTAAEGLGNTGLDGYSSRQGKINVGGRWYDDSDVNNIRRRGYRNTPNRFGQ